MPTIALCVIAKDDSEYEQLNSFIDRNFHLFDSAYITVNNRPSDKILGLSHPNGVCKTHVDFKEWGNDFAEMRNHNMERVEEDYILWLDTDDDLIHPDRILEVVDRMEAENLDWVSLEYLYSRDEFGNVNARQWKPRIMRRGTFKWVGAVHESVIPTVAVRHEKDSRVTVDHRPAEGHSLASAERNLRILQAEHGRDGEKTDPRTLYYLAQTLAGLQRYAEAIPFLDDFIRVSGWPEERYFAHHLLVRCLIWDGKAGEAVNVALAATKLFPQWSQAYLDLAECYSHLGDYAKVVEWTETGMSKDRPDTLEITNDLDYSLLPKGRLAEAFLYLGNVRAAAEVAASLERDFGGMPAVKELVATCREALEGEAFVKGLENVARVLAREDRAKAANLFELVPPGYDEDFRVQALRRESVPPRAWPEKSVVIVCAPTPEAWAWPSKFTGIGGSEEAVINMAEELTRLGYAVTVYNRCGTMRGTYQGVEYLPLYFFDSRDKFDTLIGWRFPGLFEEELRARRKYLWLHDIAYPDQFSERITANVDRVLFLSEWHRKNLPDLPDEKCFVTNNGIDPADFEDLPPQVHGTVGYFSSYDRGLLCLVRDIMPRVREQVPDAVLHVAYGWQNIDKELERRPDLRDLKAELEPLLAQDWVVHHGRLSHGALARLMGETELWAYPTEFGETNCITLQKVQAAGCMVVCTDVGALPERRIRGYVVRTQGIYGEGIYGDSFLQAGFANTVAEMIHAAPDPDGKRAVMAEARERFAWSATAKQWDEHLLKDN